jgi:MarR family multiple antibiotic resistance transcriptional regulator
MELARVGLTVPQTLVLIIVHSSPEPLTPMKLSKLMHREPHTISALLTRMEAQGLVKKERNLERGNWVRVSLTKKGKEAYQRQVAARKVRNITECLSKQELDALSEMNRKLRAKGIQLLREMLPSPYSEPLW